MPKLFHEIKIINVMMMLCCAAALTACTKAPTSNVPSSNAPLNANGNAQSSASPVSGDRTSSPMAAYRETYEATKRGDLDGYKRSVTQATLDLVTETAKRDGQTLDEALRQAMTTTPIPPSMPEMRNEKIDGERATIEVRVGSQWVTLPYAKENGEWKMALERSNDVTISDK
jgi:hypothetical protein